MALSAEKYVRELLKSGLIRENDIREFFRTFPEGAAECATGELVARELVRRKKLTQFQAQQIYAGKAKTLRLGSYTILEKIGQGGMGAVYKARHRTMDRVVALKTLPPETTESDGAVKRFRREVRAAAKLTHANIVTAYDAGEADGLHFLVMELVEGKDLTRLVREQAPLPVKNAVHYILQAARGLEYAHTEGLVHRDVKPANLLIDRSGIVKVLDMGLARIEEMENAAENDLTSTGTVMGTVDYMSPEQALNSKHADHRSDIYALGCSLHFLLTGHAVFDGETIMERMLAHRQADIPELRSKHGFVPAEVNAVFKKMVAKDVADRYQSMTEVIAALEACAIAEPSTESCAIPSEDSALQRFFEAQTVEETIVTTPNKNTPEAFTRQTDARTMVTAQRRGLSVAKTLREKRRLFFGGIVAAGVLLVAAVAYLSDGFFEGESPQPADVASGNSQDTHPPKDKPNTGDSARRTPTTVSLASGIDLLALIELPRDSVEGEWEWTAKGITLLPETNRQYARLNLQAAPNGDYEIEVEFTRHSGDESVNLHLPVADRSVNAALCAYSRWAGFSQLGRHGEGSKETGAILRIENGQRYRLRMRVQTDGDSVSLSMFLDDDSLTDWSGPVSELSSVDSWQPIGTAVMGLGAMSPTTFHAVRLKEL